MRFFIVAEGLPLVRFELPDGYGQSYGRLRMSNGLCKPCQRLLLRKPDLPGKSS